VAPTRQTDHPPGRSDEQSPEPGSGGQTATPTTSPAPARRRGLVAVRRPVVVAIALGAVVAIVAVAASAVFVSQRSVTEELVPASPVPGADLRIELSITSIDPVLGEARVRLLPVVLDQERMESGIVREGFRILVNATGGENSHTFAPGQPVQAIEYSVALAGSSVYRYPLDRYDASLVILAADGTGPEGDPLTVEYSLTSSVLPFALDADALDAADCPFGGCIALEASRPASTVGYALWFVILVWGLALAGLGVILLVARRGVELPLWVFGYLVGVLFALPPLRASLPGSPPPGGLVDFVAFYWAVAVVGLTLLGLVWLWIREARHAAP